MACRAAALRDAFVQARRQDENSEARRDEAVHPMVAHPDEPDIFGPAEEEHSQDAVHLNLFPKPTRDFPMVQQRQAAVQQERSADRAWQDEVELPDAAQMAQLQVLPVPQEQRLQEPLQVSQQQVVERARAD